MSFDGATFDPDRDESRLKRQFRAVWKFMLDGNWHTLAEIETETGFPQASISARLRDFRKDKFGGHVVQKQYLMDGLWMYRLIPNKGNKGDNEDTNA